MARNTQYRRTASDAVSWRQDQALAATIYILRNMGPTGFLLKEEGENKKFKVFLGDPHTCTCPVYTKERDLCKHICWVLLRKFRVPRQNTATWQLGLVEREINELLRGIAARQDSKPSSTAHKLAREAADATSTDGRPLIEQREISADDVCPICQEELLAKHLPVTYCKYGCGNSIHIKCMKVWADHQRSSGKEVIECPFCREDFGPQDNLRQEMRNSSIRESRAEQLSQHLGVTCRRCHMCPIMGKCYKCSVCVDFYLCQACFNTPTHNQHSFNFRQKPANRWRPAQRGSGAALPSAVVNNLQNRDISEDDYELLLQLDSQEEAQLSDLSEETISSFPLERIRTNSVLLAPGQQCRICLRPYLEAQHIRRLPCRHKFHKDCIDNWLLHQRPTCPIDGTVYTNDSVRQMRLADRARLQQRRNTVGGNQSDPRGSGRVGNSDLVLEIPGVGLARRGSAIDRVVQANQPPSTNYASMRSHSPAHPGPDNVPQTTGRSSRTQQSETLPGEQTTPTSQHQSNVTEALSTLLLGLAAGNRTALTQPAGRAGGRYVGAGAVAGRAGRLSTRAQPGRTTAPSGIVLNGMGYGPLGDSDLARVTQPWDPAASPTGSHGGSAPPTDRIAEAPSIPRPHSDNMILEVGRPGGSAGVQEREYPHRKPPTGASNHDLDNSARRGRMQTRLLQRDLQRRRSVSGEREGRSRSRERRTALSNQDNGLYIGQDPSSATGFASQFVTNLINQSHLRKPPSRHNSGPNMDRQHRWGDTREVRGEDMMLSGNALSGLTLQDFVT